MSKNAKNGKVKQKVLKLTKNYLHKVEHEYSDRKLTISTSLEKDLGMDSIALSEYFSMLEKEFNIEFSESALVELTTLKEVINAIEHGKPKKQQKKGVKKIVVGKITEKPEDAKTLLDVIRYYYDKDKDRPYLYLLSSGDKKTTVSYGKLYNESIKLANGLIKEGILTGETVAIMLPTSKEYFYAFFGILFAGAIPVPIYPPFKMDQLEDYAKRESGILDNAQARLLITFDKATTLSRMLKTLVPSIKKVSTVDGLMSKATKPPDIAISPDEPALIQYTSGSTGAPKGVLLNHTNLLENVRIAGKALNITHNDVVVSWLPLYHDMGLIGACIGSLYFGVPLVLLSPIAFLSRPEQWLWAIHRYKGTISPSPNFGFELCCKKIKEENIKNLDLSSWRIALNGAEAVLPNTIRKFTDKFKHYGFKPSAMMPVYGLAECTVALAFPKLRRLPRIDKVNQNKFAKHQKAMPSKENEDYLEFVSVGTAIPDHEVRIVDKHQKPLEERVIGEIQFKGISSMQGYYHNPEKTQSSYSDGWWKTSDMGYKADGELFITGREKDLIVRAGRNIYPEEIEEIVGKMKGIRKGCVAAIGLNKEETGTEQFIVIAEIRDKKDLNDRSLKQKISSQVNKSIGLTPDKITFVNPKTIPKTSSGKLKRSATKQAYLDNSLKKKQAHPWIQLVKIAISGSKEKLSSLLKFSLQIGYAIYISLASIILILPLWIILFFTKPSLGRKLAKKCATALLWIAFCPIKITNKSYLQQYKKLIFVANHASYIDGLALVAALPSNIVFLGKEELFSFPILRTFLKRLGYLSISRMDFRHSKEDMKKAENSIHHGHSIVIFPEGTFRFATGIKAFKLGAFKLALYTKTAICPIALRGTRQVLRGDYWLPTPHKIEIIISKPIPIKESWDDVNKLSNSVRKIIIEQTGEPSYMGEV